MMRVDGTCEARRGYHSNNKFQMTITRDGMAGYGYCQDGHWNIKFLKPAEELMYLYLTKHKLTGGSLTGIETKLLFESFNRWCKSKKVETNVSSRGGHIQITLPPKIEFSDEKRLFPDFSRAFEYADRQFKNPEMIQDLQRIASAHGKLFEAHNFSVDTIPSLIEAVSQIKDYLGIEVSNKDDVIKEFNMKILAHNEKVLKDQREYAKQHYGVQ